MIEWWHIIGMDADSRALYSASLQFEMPPDFAESGAAKAIQTACNRLRENGYDPRIVARWVVYRCTARES